MPQKFINVINIIMRYLLQTFIILFTLAVISCSSNGTGPDSEAKNNEETSTYNLDVTVNPSEGGSINPSASGSYENGEQIELQADANDEYLFVGWTGGIESSDNPLSLTIDQDYSITANFELKNYELVVNTEGEGTVNKKIVEQQSKEYEHGTVVELTASPAKGYKFVEWTGDATGTENPVQITVENPQEVTAVFEKKSFGISIAKNGEGSVVSNPDLQEFLYNSTVELEANPAQGWSFVEWEGDVTGTDTLVAVKVDTAKTITAVFENHFSGGNGTEANPYKISTVKDLQKIGEKSVYWKAHFIQINDIDASETGNWNNGKGFFPVSLAGSYDGQEFVISNLTIDRDQGYVALFGYVDAAEITNVKLENVNLAGDGSTGGLVGMSGKDSRISDSYVTGKVHCTGGRCGGLVGDNHGTIENSFADVEVTSIANDVGGLVGINWSEIRYSYATGNATGINGIGGLVGQNLKGSAGRNQIFKSYAQGQVTGKDDIGGLIGDNRADTRIDYSYATGTVAPSTSNTPTRIGGLIGRFSTTNTTLSNCYWDAENTGQAEGIPGGGGYNIVGLTTAEMTGNAAQTNMSEFDFVSIWQVVDGDYPALFWE